MFLKTLHSFRCEEMDIWWAESSCGGLGGSQAGYSQAPPLIIVYLPSFVRVENFIRHNLTAWKILK